MLGDPRRVARAVGLGAAVLTNPAGRLPHQLDQSGPDRDLPTAARAGRDPCCALDPALAADAHPASQHPLVLLSGDTTILDYSHHGKTDGLGPMGNGRGRGYLVHSVLAILPQPRQVLGLAHQIPYVPSPRPPGERRQDMPAGGRPMCGPTR